MSFANVVVFCQFSGGVGKSTLSVNIAGLLAAGGNHVLLVDLDSQADTGMNLGIEPTDGQELYDALVNGQPAPVQQNVRPNLDLILGGEQVEYTRQALVHPDKYRHGFENMLAPIAHTYDFIIVDTPPKDPQLVQGLLGVAGALVVPQDGDYGTLRTTRRLVGAFQGAREINPELEFLGMVLFGFASTATALAREMREAIAEAFNLDPAEQERRFKAGTDGIRPLVEPAFRSSIRAAKRAAADARDPRYGGLLIQELADQAAGVQGVWRDHLSGKPGRLGKAGNADALLEDYIAVTREFIERYTWLREHNAKPVLATEGN